MSMIGVSDFKYSVLEKDDESGVKYGAWMPVAGLVSIGVRPQSNTTTNYADNGAFEVANSLGEISISIEQAAIPESVKAVLLGHELNADGEMIYAAGDDSPYVALMFKGKQSDGTNKFVKILKVKFAEMADDYTTEKNSIEFKNYSIEGKAVCRIFDKQWKRTINETDTNAAAVEKFVAAVEVV